MLERWIWCHGDWGVTISAFLNHGLMYDEALIRQCRCVHSLVARTKPSKHFCVASALVDAYAKCGDITAAERAFFVVSSSTEDTILYNTMLTAYANHGDQ